MNGLAGRASFAWLFRTDPWSLNDARYPKSSPLSRSAYPSEIGTSVTFVSISRAAFGVQQLAQTFVQHVEWPVEANGPAVFLPVDPARTSPRGSKCSPRFEFDR